MGRENCPLVTLARIQKQWDLRDSFMTASAHLQVPKCHTPPFVRPLRPSLTQQN